MKVFSAIHARIRNAHSDHHAIAKGMAWVVFFVFIGKLAGAAKEMAIAYRYGVSAEVDIYIFVFNLVSLPVGIWFSVLTVVLVPLAARYQHNTSNHFPRFRSELFGLTLVLGAVLFFWAWLFLPLLLHSSWVGLPASSIVIATEMMPTLSVLAPLGVLISLFSALLLAAGRHTNTLLEGVPALVILIGLMFFSSAGVEPLVWATLVGYVFHMFSLVAVLAKRNEIAAPKFSYQSPCWPVFWQGFGIMLAGQALMSFTGIIDQFYAAHLDTGSIATLSYANRILALILGLGATAISRATLPVFSSSQAQGATQYHLHRIARYWVQLLFVLGVGAMIIGWWLSPLAVRLLFERGAFVAQNTESVTHLLRYGLLQLPFYFVGILFVSILTSQSRYKMVTLIGGINLIVKIIFNHLLVERMGVNGIMLATTLMLIISTLMLGAVLYHDLHKGKVNENSKFN